jgi:hypothetical protein
MKEVFLTMPAVKDIGIEHWLDLFMIRIHLVKTAVEQSRSDRMLVNYMPSVQPSVLKKVFELPVKERNNKLFYKIIKDFSPSLSKIPLVKGDVTYPFGLGNLSSSLLVKLKSKLRLGYKDDLLIRFLGTLSEYAQETIISQDFISCEYYDHNKIRNMVEEFYREKNLALANDVNWWLTFELWRKTIQSK